MAGVIEVPASFFIVVISAGPVNETCGGRKTCLSVATSNLAEG